MPALATSPVSASWAGGMWPFGPGPCSGFSPPGSVIHGPRDSIFASCPGVALVLPQSFLSCQQMFYWQGWGTGFKVFRRTGLWCWHRRCVLTGEVTRAWKSHLNKGWCVHPQILSLVWGVVWRADTDPAWDGPDGRGMVESPLEKTFLGLRSGHELESNQEDQLGSSLLPWAVPVLSGSERVWPA